MRNFKYVRKLNIDESMKAMYPVITTQRIDFACPEAEHS